MSGSTLRLWLYKLLQYSNQRPFRSSSVVNILPSLLFITVVLTLRLLPFRSLNLLMHRPSLMRALKCLYFFTITFTPVLKVIIYLMTDLVRQLIVRGFHRRYSTNFTAFLN